MIDLGRKGDFIAVVQGDSHVTGQNPISRKDFYPDTILRKQEEVLELAATVEADMILGVGDVFHAPDPSNTTKGRLGAILQNKPCPFYSIAGNHDLFGGNMATYPRTGMGLIEKLKALTLIHDDKPLIFRKGKLRIQLTGQNYHFNIDHRDPVMDYCRKKADGVTHAIHLAHGYLTDKKLLFPHTLISRIKDETEVDATFSGHLHTSFFEEHDGKIFANPGAMGRISASKGEMRAPHVFILRITQEGELTVEKYFLKTAEKAEDVLDRSHLKDDDAHFHKMSEFLDGITHLTQNANSVLDIYEILHQLTSDEDIDPDVKQDALAAISEAETELQGGGNTQ